MGQKRVRMSILEVHSSEFVLNFLAYLGVTTVDFIDCLCILDNHSLLADEELFALAGCLNHLYVLFMRSFASCALA